MVKKISIRSRLDQGYVNVKSSRAFVVSRLYFLASKKQK